jgi:hypothetical protein
MHARSIGLRVLLTGLCVPLVGMPAPASMARAGTPDSEALRGEALFTGKADLIGRIYTHRVDLPPAVVRCGNCHAADDGPPVPRSLAPRLNQDLLIRMQPRRGGPASAYDGQKFCTLLRRGLDPAFVLISVEMPRYTIEDADCQALWRYLNESPGTK